MKIVNGRTIFSQSTHDRYVVAVDVGGTNMEGAVVDLSGSIVLQKHMASQGSDAAEIRLIRLINSLFEESGFEKSQFAGIALGVPGVTDSTGQWFTLAPGLGWL